MGPIVSLYLTEEELSEAKGSYADQVSSTNSGFEQSLNQVALVRAWSELALAERMRDALFVALGTASNYIHSLPCHLFLLDIVFL